MDDLLPYFERELVALRRLGREFHERYPRIGGALQLGDDTCPDPHVEQLIQSVALLSARVAKRLDDSYPELTEALLETLFPHYLRPFPSCSIARATTPAIKSAGEAPLLTIARGTEMDSATVDGVRCCFRTAYDITLSPVTLSGARFDSLSRAPSNVTMPASASAGVSIVIEGAVPVDLPFLRVFIDGEPSFCAALRDALFLRAVCAHVEAEPGYWSALPFVPLAPVGFAEDEALIPFEARSHVAYRVLSEYFVFPEKFNFVDIDLAALRPLLPAQCRRFTLHVGLAGLRPDSAHARILASLSEDNLLLGCSPVVNLCQRPGQPISVTQLAADYAVVADAAHAASFEVYSVDSVKMVRRRGQNEVVTEFRPFYSLRHGEAAGDRKGHYWMLRDDAGLASLSPGHEKRITLIDADFNPMLVEKTSLSIALTCTNRDLPHALKYGQPGGDLTPLRDADSYSVRLLRRPSRSCRFAKGSGQWRLISHLTVNHHALSQGGLPALREMLALYDLQQSPISRRQIDGVTGLQQAETVA